MGGWRQINPPLFSLRHAELVSASIVPRRPKGAEAKWTLKQVQGDNKEVKPTPQKHRRSILRWGDGSWVLLPQSRHTFGLILGNQCGHEFG